MGLSGVVDGQIERVSSVQIRRLKKTQTLQSGKGATAFVRMPFGRVTLSTVGQPSTLTLNISSLSKMTLRRMSFDKMTISIASTKVAKVSTITVTIKRVLAKKNHI